MPSYKAKSKILDGAANAVVEITLTREHKFVEVTNWGSTVLAVTVDGSDPTQTASECDYIGPGQSLTLESYNEPDVIKATSTGAFSVSARGLQA